MKQKTETNFQTFKFQNEPITFIAPSWQDLSDITDGLARELIESKMKIDLVITLAKGGWPMVRSLVDFLAISTVSSIGVKFYKGINETTEKPEIYQDLPITTDVKGKNIVLYDDVADTGRSLLFVKEYLEKLGAKNVIVVSLFHKPHSLIKPDFYGAETEDWIIFPYELRETLEVLAKRWKEGSVSEEEIVERFIGLGFKSHQVLYYLNQSLQK